MDLRTSYLGLELRHPLIAAASPLSSKLESAQRLEESGAAGLVLQSIFQEQLSSQQAKVGFTEPVKHLFRPRAYLEYLGQLKGALEIPVIASVNACHTDGLRAYARRLAEAGADALEVNVYFIGADPDRSAAGYEDELVALFTELCETLSIPVSVKLTPFFTSLSHFAGRLDKAGVAGLVLFNRFYQSDVSLAERDVQTVAQLSDPRELLLRLRWLAILSGQVEASLAVSGGVHSEDEATKALLCGANVVQLCSVILKQGPGVFQSMLDSMRQRLASYGADSLEEVQGELSLQLCPDPASYERTLYQQVLRSWKLSQ